MKTQKFALITISITLLLALAACTAPTLPNAPAPYGGGRWGNAPQGSQGNVAPRGGGGQWNNNPPAGELQPGIHSELLPPPSELNQTEADGLIFMREEEKLAHDVYLALYQKWNLQTFNNIANSEQNHTDSIKQLLDIYKLADPSTGKAAGQFTNPELQKLYDTLVSQGSRSMTDALKVGAAIEEIDILDLQKRIAETDNTDIRQVYQNLEFASGNHLRSFVGQLTTRANETYQPQYLSAQAYQAIVGGVTASGPGGGQGQGNPGRGQRGRIQ